MTACTLELNRQWRSTCKVVLGQDIGPMEDYADWLRYGNEPITPRHSMVSGREMVSAPPHYAQGGKWMALDEVDFGKKFEPLSINDLKDIDSLVLAARERFIYSGDIYFGQSGHIEQSSNINDSFYVYKTASFGNSKHWPIRASGAMTNPASAATRLTTPPTASNAPGPSRTPARLSCG